MGYKRNSWCPQRREENSKRNTARRHRVKRHYPEENVLNTATEMKMLTAKQLVNISCR